MNSAALNCFSLASDSNSDMSRISDVLFVTWRRSYAPKEEDFPSKDAYRNEIHTNYFKELYKNEGYNSLIVCIDDFLRENECKDDEDVIYLVEGDRANTRWNYAVDCANKIQDQVEAQRMSILDEPIPDINVVPISPISMIKSSQVSSNVIDQSIIDAYLEMDWDFNGSKQAIEMYKIKFTNTFFDYQCVLDQERKLARQKEQLMKQFAEEVNEWSHLKFEKPTQEPGSIQRYLTSKYNQLKSLIPNGRINPNIMRRIKEGDYWTRKLKNNQTFEDELLPTRRI